MKADVLLLWLFFWFHDVMAQKGLQCFVPGECLDSQILGATPTNSSRECWRHCQSVTGCTWFTFYKDSQVCTPLSGCLRLSNEKCQENCISGEEECPEVQCGVHGRCYGALEGIRKVANAKECASMCGQRDECFWNTYDPEHESCLMTNDCPLLDRTCSNCSSSERDCTAEMDANINTSIEDDPKGTSGLLMGTCLSLKQHYFNLDSNTTGKCKLPTFAVNTIVQHTMVDNVLHGCGHIPSDGVVCFKYNADKMYWIRTDLLKIMGGSLLYLLPIPNRGILILIKSNILYLYNGKKIEQVSKGFPFSTPWFQTPFCRTVISSDEILVGFSHQYINRTIKAYPQLRSINIKTGVFNNIKLPNLVLMDSVCGAFGPKGNRKVAIFGGRFVKNGKPERDFDRTLILDWNSKTFVAHGSSVKTSTSDIWEQTVAHRDTFLFYESDYTGTRIYKFDINGTETPISYLGVMPATCFNLANIPEEVAGCK
ncbi:hypothetical protein TCAL_14862 [Tigriopus californicus]|uniref:Apple domain-containing protein n=1 Tax=Tigriopus californicus TaxID=6832 RepID=A0A553P254_TIGCA|nr:hypothetical protein TCAL_14862 [Tigriopus californicus]